MDHPLLVFDGERGKFITAVLRPGGRLACISDLVPLIVASPLDDEDAPVTERLERPLFGMHRFA
jgi:hypothetical protein